MKKVLVNFDSFENGVKLVNSISTFCSELVNNIHLLLVVEEETIEYYSTLNNKSPEAIVEEKRLEYEQIARSVISEFQGAFSFTWSVQEGLLGETIISAAKKEKVDMIVLGAQQEKITKRIVSSPIPYVAETSPVPVLLIPLR